MSKQARVIISAGVVVSALGVGAVVGATQPWGAPTSLNRQASTVNTTAATVHDQAWHSAMPFLRFCPHGQVAVTVSMAFTGSIAYKVIVDDGPTALPGPVAAGTASSTSTSSFTFLWNAQPFEANDHHYVQLWWRAATPSGATLRAATLVTQYQEGSLRC